MQEIRIFLSTLLYQYNIEILKYILVYFQVMECNKMPSLVEVLDGLGLGPRGPPIPPPAGFAVVPYPVKRHAPPGAEGGHYVFVANGPDDP